MLRNFIIMQAVSENGIFVGPTNTLENEIFETIAQTTTFYETFNEAAENKNMSKKQCNFIWGPLFCCFAQLVCAVGDAGIFPVNKNLKRRNA